MRRAVVVCLDKLDAVLVTHGDDTIGHRLRTGRCQCRQIPLRLITIGGIDRALDDRQRRGMALGKLVPELLGVILGKPRPIDTGEQRIAVGVGLVDVDRPAQHLFRDDGDLAPGRRFPNQVTVGVSLKLLDDTWHDSADSLLLAVLPDELANAGTDPERLHHDAHRILVHGRHRLIEPVGVVALNMPGVAHDRGDTAGNTPRNLVIVEQFEQVGARQVGALEHLVHITLRESEGRYDKLRSRLDRVGAHLA